MIDTDKRPGFKLYFRIPDPPGIHKKYLQPAVVTTKFYVKQPKLPLTDEEINERIKKLIPVAPQDKYKKPLTENQIYGWYHQVILCNTNKSDRRLNFAKHTNQIIKEILMSYEK